MASENNISNVQIKNISITGNTLKFYAVCTMLLEHFAVFVPADNPIKYIMLFFGKSAAPLFFYFIVEGYHHTHNRNQYTRNLAIFAAISYIPFILCFDGALTWETCLNLNVIFTLLIGLLVIRARHEIQNPFTKYFIIGLLFILSCFGDWGYIAPLIILTFDVFYGDVKKQAYAYALIALVRPIMQSNLIVNILSPVFSLANPHIRSLDFSSWDILLLQQMGALLPIFLLNLYNGKKGKSNSLTKWGFYIIYPLHLLIIGIIKILISI